MGIQNQTNTSILSAAKSEPKKRVKSVNDERRMLEELEGWAIDDGIYALITGKSTLLQKKERVHE
jgi:hypothetical protein